MKPIYCIIVFSLKFALFLHKNQPQDNSTMAKIKFGAIVTDIRGSIDSVTYSKSKYGAYARKKVTPVNPNTALQAEVRSIFGAASSLFRSLGTATIAAWNAVAAEYTRSNVFGDNLPLSGATLFTKMKTQLVNLGYTTNPSPINPVTLPAIDASGATADVSDGTIEIQGLSATDANQMIAVYGSAPVSAGRTFVGKSQMRLLTVVSPSTASGDLDITGPYESVFGDVLISGFVGQKLRIQAKYVDIRNGQAGTPKSLDVAITA